MGKPAWVFENTPEMGGATGGAFTNTLLGAGMEPAAVLAREAIQNSVDASEKGAKVSVQFRKVRLNGAEKFAFVKALRIGEQLRTHSKNVRLPKGSCFEHLDDPAKPLDLLFIEDFGTVGLFGPAHKSKSHFFRLLLSLGNDAKASGAEGSGGSYGFGKSVYSSNSRIHTIVAYSAFDKKLCGSEPAHDARLMACSYFNQHEQSGEDYTGRAWFGNAFEATKRVDPLIDSDAHKLATSLGFASRASGLRGTSLLVVDCDVDCSILRDSIEEWWWPRLLDEELGLDVAIFDGETQLAPPRPRKRPDLKPFIECFDLAIGRSIPLGAHQKAGPFQRMHDKPLGDYGFVVVPEDDMSDERLKEKLGRVALIRAPRMVIEYMQPGGTIALPCVGVFVASPEIDTALKRSEPATHDKWDPKSGRLSELGPEARDWVEGVLRRLKSQFHAFAKAALPPAPKQELRLRALERLLGGALKPPGGGGGGGGHTSDPIAISFLEEPALVQAKDRIATKGVVKIGLSEHADRNQIRVRVAVHCLVQEDDGVSREDPVTVHLHSDDPALEGPSQGSELLFKLTKSSNARVSFTTDPYAPDWTTHLQVDVQEIQ